MIKKIYFQAPQLLTEIIHAAIAKFKKLKNVNILEIIIVGIVFVEPTFLVFAKFCNLRCSTISLDKPLFKSVL